MIALPLQLSNFLVLPKVLYLKLAWSNRSSGYLSVKNEKIKAILRRESVRSLLLNPCIILNSKEKIPF